MHGSFTRAAYRSQHVNIWNAVTQSRKVHVEMDDGFLHTDWIQTNSRRVSRFRARGPDTRLADQILILSFPLDRPRLSVENVAVAGQIHTDI